MARIPGNHVAEQDDTVEAVGGNLRVEAGVHFVVEGNVGGNVEVNAEADLLVEGNVGGNLTIDDGAFVTIDGNVGGNVRTEGEVELHGRVGGNVEISNLGEVDVDEDRVGGQVRFID